MIIFISASSFIIILCLCIVIIQQRREIDRIEFLMKVEKEMTRIANKRVEIWHERYTKAISKHAESSIKNQTKND